MAQTTAMNTLAADIERELRHMDRESARSFERAVRQMLLLMKTRTVKSTGLPLGERIKNHPAIGTWPKNLDPDTHIATLRAEWE